MSASQPKFEASECPLVGR